MRLSSLAILLLPLTLLLQAAPAFAQESVAEVVIPQESVRHDYAQVLRVEPVYQILRTTRNERVCDAQGADGTGATRAVSTLRNRIRSTVTREEREAGYTNCRIAPVVRELRRPIAYDVDYVYKGSKFRTRLARDPGNRLRVRVSITPQP